MSNINAVTTLMARNLQKLGYPTTDIRWSLGYCQGDGSSFAGPIDIKILGPRLFPDVSIELWSSIESDLEIIRCNRTNYVHERSVGLNIDSQCVALSEASEFGGEAQKVLLHKLVCAIESEIVSVARQNSIDGYRLLESYQSEKERVWVFRTASFLVEVFKVPDESYDPFEMSDAESMDQVIKTVLEGKISFFGISVTAIFKVVVA